MFLPEYVLNCICALEKAGYACYAVGGCVRDACLGLKPQDYDLCTSARPQQIKAVFSGHELVLAGEKHGTVGVIAPEGVVEITTFRTEGGYTDSRHPDWVEFVDAVESDLSRRDFTVNAMAYSPTRGFSDPFGGRQDLEKGVLRAVGHAATRFQEDALRILRGIRFSVTYNLEIEPLTLQAMLDTAPLLTQLAKERVFEELCKLLPRINARQLISFAPILAQVLPPLKPTIGFLQHSPYHAYDVFTHTAYVTQAVPTDLTLRWAALLHDIGKVPSFSLDETGRGHFYDHAKLSAEMADSLLLQLKAPTALRERVVLLIEKHMTQIEPEKKIVRRWISRLGYEMLDALLILQKADMDSKGTGTPEESQQFPLLRSMVEETLAENACLSVKDLAVNGHDLMALGYTGKEIGRQLERLLNLVLDEIIPNEKAELLRCAKEELI